MFNVRCSARLQKDSKVHTLDTIVFLMPALLSSVPNFTCLKVMIGKMIRLISSNNPH